MSQNSDSAEKVTNIESAKVRRAKQRVELGSLLTDISICDIDADMAPIETIELEGFLDRLSRLPRAYDDEVARALVAHFGLPEKDVWGLKETVKRLREELSLGIPAKEKKEKTRQANRSDYYELYETVIGPLRRDIFTGELLRKGDEGFWVPAINFLSLVKSEAAVFEQEGACKFIRPLIEDHFYQYTETKRRELILDIPDWDGEDRIAAMAQAIELDGSQGELGTEEVEEILKCWMKGVFARLSNHKYQNPVLILHGPQGIGKDYFIDTLTDGLGQWAKQLALTGNHKDDFSQLSRALVFKISEFDKTAKTEQSVLKDLIWRPDCYIRDAYARAPVDKINRCSFVASCNDDDIYKDPSGHRRYWPINLAKISWNYPSSIEDKKQITAQAMVLNGQSFEVSKKTQLIIREYLESRKPDSIEDELAELWEHEVSKWLDSVELSTSTRERILRKQWIAISEARDVGLIGKICKAYGVSERYLGAKLAVKGYRVKNNSIRGYKISLSVPSVPLCPVKCPVENEEIQEIIF